MDSEYEELIFIDVEGEKHDLEWAEANVPQVVSCAFHRSEPISEASPPVGGTLPESKPGDGELGNVSGPNTVDPVSSEAAAKLDVPSEVDTEAVAAANAGNAESVADDGCNAPYQSEPGDGELDTAGNVLGPNTVDPVSSEAAAELDALPPEGIPPEDDGDGDDYSEDEDGIAKVK